MTIRPTHRKQQKTVECFPTPDELFKRYTQCSFEEKIQPNPLLYAYHHIYGDKYPWYFQEAAIENIIEAILRRKKRILLAMATGTGKTYVAFQVVRKLLRSGYSENASAYPALSRRG